MNQHVPLDPATAEEFAASVDRGLDLTAALQVLIRDYANLHKLTRFEVVTGLVATIATCAAKMGEPEYSFALGAIRTADFIVEETRRLATAGDGPDTYHVTRAALHSAFARARSPVMQ